MSALACVTRATFYGSVKISDTHKKSPDCKKWPGCKISCIYVPGGVYLLPMNTFQPWTKYPSLSRERLSAIANIIRRVRTETVALHDAAGGDSEWSLGCRAYSRTCHAIRASAKNYAWLTILHENENLRFSFVIGTVPFRFYRGRPDDPPDRYLISTYGELHHLQTVLALEGLRPLDRILRLAVETDATREVSNVTLVEMDEAGNVTDTYTIPFDVEQANVTLLQAKPVELPPVTVEPIQELDEGKKHRKQDTKGNERKIGS